MFTPPKASARSTMMLVSGAVLLVKIVVSFVRLLPFTKSWKLSISVYTRPNAVATGPVVLLESVFRAVARRPPLVRTAVAMD
uniref:Putative secreted protein n=1 Tax=Anopheles darlingi TaxID=43151 RepID=A0A2M4DH20_ANODA